VVRLTCAKALVVVVCCLLRGSQFRFGDAVEAVQGGPLDVDDSQITSAPTPASRSLIASEYGKRQPAEGLLAGR
jgi:hypothetical protein